jgi:predicted amidophosphoribosyltransferase
MYGPNRDGKCAVCGAVLPHVRLTCSDCGLEYDDCEDWSGPAHSRGDCIAHLKKRLAGKASGPTTGS